MIKKHKNIEAVAFMRGQRNEARHQKEQMRKALMDTRQWLEMLHRHMWHSVKDQGGPVREALILQIKTNDALTGDPWPQGRPKNNTK